jgi:hypothetical protein
MKDRDQDKESVNMFVIDNIEELFKQTESI